LWISQGIAMKITAAKAAEELGVKASTIKEWAQRLGIGRRTSTGVWVFEGEHMHMLRIVHTLVREGRGFNTITRRLSGESPPAQATPPALRPETDEDLVLEEELEDPPGEETDEVVPQDVPATLDPGEAQETRGPFDFQGMVNQVLNAVSKQAQLVDKFAWASNQMGKLEGENDFLRTHLHELKQLLNQEAREKEELRHRVEQMAQRMEEQRRDSEMLFRKLERASEQIARMRVDITHLTRQVTGEPLMAEESPPVEAAPPTAPPPAPSWWRRVLFKRIGLF
jgi:DNA-binding transcriptional MerR regulator